MSRTIVGTLLAGTLLATALAGAALAADRDPHGLAQLFAKELLKKRQEASSRLVPRIHATDFQGTDLGCIVLVRRELRPHGYPGHAFLCEAAVSGEVLGSILNKSGRRLCDITGAYTNDFCYDLDFCGNSERLCVTQ